jgi:hypothetical protein
MGALIHAPMQAPPNRQASLGLAPVATPAPDPPENWEAGFAFDPETCQDPQLHAIDCGTGVTKNRMSNPGFVLYAPASIIANSWCSTLTGARQTRERAQRAIAGSQWWALELLLWTGVAESDDPADGTVRPHLADGRATVLTGSGDVAEGVARLDQALTDCLWDSPGVIHMTAGLLSRAAQKGAVERENGRWISPAGHAVVGGGGYTGGAPRASVGAALPAAPNLLADPIPAQTMYGTGPVFFLLGEVFETQEIVREVNDSSVRVERAGAVFYGPCCQFAVSVVAET